MTKTLPNRARGSVTAEAAASIFMAIMFIMLVVYVGRITTAFHDVRTAAHEGARAGSQSGNLDAAIANAERVAIMNLPTQGCADGLVIDTSGDFVPGGFVTVTISCDVALSDLGFLPVPGSQNLSTSATEVIDVFREDVE